jgi:hypothetical protein
LTLDVDVGKNHFVDAVEVPLIEGRHLVGPARYPRVSVTGDDGHRPFLIDRLAVGAGALHRVPSRRVGRPVEEQVGLRIVGEPSPGGAAANLPLIAVPGFQRGVLADGLAQRHGLLWIEQRFCVWAQRIGAPRLLAGLGIVGGDVAPHAELGSGDANDDLVLHRQHGGRIGLTLLGITVDDLPFLLPSLCLKRNQGGVRLMQIDGIVSVGEATIDGIATHHWNDGGILLGLVFPEDFALVLQIERIDDIGKGRVDVHDVAHHKRRALMATQHAGRERPSNF